MTKRGKDFWNVWGFGDYAFYFPQHYRFGVTGLSLGKQEEMGGGSCWVGGRDVLTGSGQKNEVEAEKVWGHRIVGTSVYRLLVLVAQLANKGMQPHKTFAFCTATQLSKLAPHFKYGQMCNCLGFNFPGIPLLFLRSDSFPDWKYWGLAWANDVHPVRVHKLWCLFHLLKEQRAEFWINTLGFS